MPEEHYKKFKEHIKKRNEYKKMANERRTASKAPVIADLDNWLASRHEAKSKEHEKEAFESIDKHVDALRKKHDV